MLDCAHILNSYFEFELNFKIYVLYLVVEIASYRDIC